MGLGGSKRSDNSGRDRIAVQKKCKVTPRAACQNILKIPKFLPDYFFVTKTMSSLFVDEDGDVAHEFYYETFDENNSSRLVKKVDNLRPLGPIEYAIPRLRADSPFVIWEARSR
ncbi:unnamed protein product [Enterobius vermicularis]|uniref:DM10 domain-containing protein n=1 Tax=Enterobius vermicularis TaxID=51028 RepID=A0A0N4VG31_ENTVE|nr:unnamed protein product [Enterobius vermicularis]